MPVVLPRPLPGLGHRLFHYRPVLFVQVSGSQSHLAFDGLLDTGADETVFQERVAQSLGIDLTGAEERQIDLIGRPAPIRVRYAAVTLQITDGLRETYAWSAVVGFAATRLRYNLLGHGGFLEHFDIEFRGADRVAVVMPNAAFPGSRLALTPRP